tara:strand:+ start:379 stop:1956 length:1578 start_codon:yes stop_codon:yes gene_type:complete
MARKNQWEQFASSFDTFYNIGNKIQKGIGARKIMDEEVETLYSKDAGSSPHASGEGIGSGTQYKYDGKMYKEQITSDQLTGLRNKRLADNMVRFGDSEGAMKFNLSNAELKAANSKSRLDDATFDSDVLSKKLANDATAAGLDLTKAQINEYKTLTPLKATKWLAEIASQQQQTAENRALMPGKVTLQDQAIGLGGNTLSKSEIDLKEYKSEAATGIRESSRQLTIAEQANETLRKKRDKDIITSTYANDVATALLNSGQAKNEAEAAKMASDIDLQGSKTLTEFARKSGAEEFESPEAQKAWLIDAWDKSHDPRIKTMLGEMNAVELSEITMNGSRVMTQVNAALSSGTQNAQKAALVKIMDEEDGIVGNMRFETDKKTSIVRLVEYPSAEEMEAGTNGQAVINEFGTTKGWDGFTQGLEAEFTPLKSLEIAKANAEIKKLNAEAKFKNDESRLKMTLEETKSWGDHTQTDLFKQLATKSAVEFKKTTGFDTMDEYAKDYIARMRTATGATDYTGWSSTETTPK